MIETFFLMIKQNANAKLRYKLLTFLFKPVLTKIKNTIDYRNAASALIIGLPNWAIKCHGSADMQSYLGAFKQIKTLSQSGFSKILKGK